MNPSRLLRQAPDSYKDLPFRIIIALLAAHIIVSFGEKESLFQLLLMPDYYRSLGFSFVIAFILVCIVHATTVSLDRRFDWRSVPVVRAGLQFSLALLLPAILAFLLAFFYFRAFGLHILDTLYLKYDFPVIVLMLVLLNIYYLAFYFYRRWRDAEQLAASIPDSVTEAEAQQGHVEFFLVQQGASSIPIPVPDIACFYRDGDYNFLKTFEGTTHLVSQTLDEIESRLHSRHFFRANRQVIIQFRACTAYETLAYGKLEIKAQPALKEPIVVSQRKARQFREWMER